MKHEDLSKQNQNKGPELGEDVIICLLSIYGFTYIIAQYDTRRSSYYRERGNLKHVVLAFGVEGQDAISGDRLVILLIQIRTTASLIVHSVLINGKVEDS